MPDFWCKVIDAGINVITLADDPPPDPGRPDEKPKPSFERIQFCPNPEDKKAMLAIGLVAMTSGRDVWVRVDAANEGSIIRDMSLV